MDNIITIFGTGLVAAILTGIITIFICQKNLKLKYVTEERQKWRENIRNLTSSILTSCAKKDLIQMSLNLNPYKNSKDSEINDIITKTLEKGYFKKSDNEKFRKLTANLLKYEWEKAKYEVQFFKFSNKPKRKNST